jgi:hypothetical protein
MGLTRLIRVGCGNDNLVEDDDALLRPSARKGLGERIKDPLPLLGNIDAAPCALVDGVLDVTCLADADALEMDVGDGHGRGMASRGSVTLEDLLDVGEANHGEIPPGRPIRVGSFLCGALMRWEWERCVRRGKEEEEGREVEL